MSHLQLSLVNRLNKTESAVFIFLMLLFQRIPLSDKLEIETSVVVSCGGPKRLPVHRFSVVMPPTLKKWGTYWFRLVRMYVCTYSCSRYRL